MSDPLKKKDSSFNLIASSPGPGQADLKQGQMAHSRTMPAKKVHSNLELNSQPKISEPNQNQSENCDADNQVQMMNWATRKNNRENEDGSDSVRQSLIKNK